MSQAEDLQRMEYIKNAMSATNKLIVASRYKIKKKYQNTSVVPDTEPFYDIYECDNIELWKEINKDVNDLYRKINLDSKNKIYLKTCLKSMIFFIYTLTIIDENIEKKIRLENEQNIDINIIIGVEKNDEKLKKYITTIYNGDNNVFTNIAKIYNYIVDILEKYLDLATIAIDNDDYLNPVKIKLILIKLAIYIYQELSIDIQELIRKINYTMDIKNNQFGSSPEKNKKLIIDKVNQLLDILDKFTKIIAINNDEFSKNKILEDNIMLLISHGLNTLRMQFSKF